MPDKYIDTSAEALLKLAVDLDTIGPDHVMRVPTHQSAAVLLRSAATLRALAAERTAAAPDVVERVARALTRQQINRHRRRDHRPVNEEAIAKSVDANWHWEATDAAAALAAIRPGDEVPAGVVVPREMTEEMIEAASHAGLRARDLIRDKHPHRRGFADAEWLPASWRAALAAIKGGEDA